MPALTTITTQGSTDLPCPTCWGENRTEMPVWEFSDTTVEVTVCDSCKDKGLVSVTTRVSGLLGL